MSKQTKTKKTTKKPASNKKTVAKQAAPAKAVKAKAAGSVGKAVGISVAVSAVVAAGLGVGGFFLGKTLGGNGGGGGGGEGGDSNLIVYLNATDEGDFGGGKTFTLIENVKSGTKLNEIEGYLEPTSLIEKKFDHWVVSGSDSKYEVTNAVTANTYLTAFYVDTPASARAKAKKEIRDFYQTMINSLDPADVDLEEKKEALGNILNAATSDKSPISTIEDAKIIEATSSLTTRTMVAITAVDKSLYPYIELAFEDQLDEISGTSKYSVAKSLAIATISSNYLKVIEEAFDPLDLGKLDETALSLKEFVLKEETTDEKAEIVSMITPGILSASYWIVDDTVYNTFVDSIIKNTDYIFEMKNGYPDTPDILKTLGEIVNDFYAALAKTPSAEFVNKLDSLFETVKKDLQKLSEEIKASGTVKFYLQECFRLSKFALNSIATSPDIQDSAPYLSVFEQLIKVFNEACNIDKSIIEKDDSVKIAQLSKISESFIKGMTRYYDYSGGSDQLLYTMSEKIATDIISSKFDASVVGLANEILNSFANMPTGMYFQPTPYSRFNEIISEDKILESLYTAIQGGVSNDLISAAVSLNTAYIKLLGIFDTGDAAATLKGERSTITTALFNKNASSKYDAMLVTSLYEEFITLFSNEEYFYRVPECITEIDNYYKAAKASFDNNVPVEIKEEVREFYMTNFADHLSKFANNLMPLLLVEGADSYGQEFKKIFDYLYSYQGNLLKADVLPAWKNSIKTLAVYADAESFFYCEDENGEYNLNGAFARINYMRGQISAKNFPYAVDYSGDFEGKVVPVWKEYFSSIEPTDTEDDLKQGFEIARKKIDEAIK